MSLQSFAFRDHPVRVVLDDAGDPWFVATDVAKILGYAGAKDMTRVMADDEKGGHNVPTLGGTQAVATISEPGLYGALMRRRAGAVDNAEIRGRVIHFQRWVTHEVLPTIRRTGSYTAPAPVPAPAPMVRPTRLQIAQRLLDAEERAAAGEVFKRAIETSEGLTPREFHKKYLSDVPERVFFDHLYKRGYLINQRGCGTKREDGTFRDGSQHRHPGWKGKPWFYLSSHVDRFGERRQQARVRPGAPELELRDMLAKQGLAVNPSPSAQLELTDGSEW